MTGKRYLAAAAAGRALAGALSLAGSTPQANGADTRAPRLPDSVTSRPPRHTLRSFRAMRGSVDRGREDTLVRRRGTPRVLTWVTREGYVSAVCKSDQPVRIPPNPDLAFSGRLAMRRW